MRVRDFDYVLPPARIAQSPAPQRDAAQLYVLPQDVVRPPLAAAVAPVAAVLHFLVIPVFMLYLLHDMERIQAGIAELVPPHHRDLVFARMREVDGRLSAFARGLGREIATPDEARKILGLTRAQ